MGVFALQKASLFVDDEEDEEAGKVDGGSDVDEFEANDPQVVDEVPYREDQDLVNGDAHV